MAKNVLKWFLFMFLEMSLYSFFSVIIGGGGLGFYLQWFFGGSRFLQAKNANLVRPRDIIIERSLKNFTRFTYCY